jgi:tetratricopeptide (TPR) repeat protein
MTAAVTLATRSYAEPSRRSPTPASPSATTGAEREASRRLVDDAEETIKKASQRDPIDSTLIRQAIAKLKQAIERDPRNDSAYVDLGFAYGLLKEPSIAVDMYRKAVEINPSPANFKELADIYMRVGNPEEALMAANAGLTRNSRDPGLYNARGMALMNMERFDEAELAFREALEIDPSFAAAKVNLDAMGSDYKARGTITKKKTNLH